MLSGIQLTLMIGPVMPVPAPQSVMEALLSISVSSGKDKSGFQITFGVSKKSTLMTTLLPAGYFTPITTRVIIAVTLGGLPNVLMDGIVTRQELAASSEPGQSTLTITGEDLSVLMDLVEWNIIRYPAMPEIARVYLILAKYLIFGIVPIALPPIPPDVTLPTDKIRTHRGTDLFYLRKLAREAGYVFYVDPGPLPGQSIAYFGPEVRIPIPQPALNINMDSFTNVESMTFSFDGLAKKILVFSVMTPPAPGSETIPIQIPLPNISVLRPPMGLFPPLPSKLEYDDEGASDTTIKTIQRMLGYSFNASDSVTVQGSLDVLRYGNILRSKMMVGVRGAGIAYDGLYYVNSVTHNIKRGEYKQNFELSRDGLIANTPVVPI